MDVGIVDDEAAAVEEVEGFGVADIGMGTVKVYCYLAEYWCSSEVVVLD